MVFKAAPLNSSFMLVGIIGFIISSLYIYGKNPAWGFTFSLLFLLMIIAALVSMAKAKPILPLYTRRNK
jgi:hypothetical protein